MKKPSYYIKQAADTASLFVCAIVICAIIFGGIKLMIPQSGPHKATPSKERSEHIAKPAQVVVESCKVIPSPVAVQPVPNVQPETLTLSLSRKPGFDLTGPAIRQDRANNLARVIKTYWELASKSEGKPADFEQFIKGLARDTEASKDIKAYLEQGHVGGALLEMSSVVAFQTIIPPPRALADLSNAQVRVLWFRTRKLIDGGKRYKNYSESPVTSNLDEIGFRCEWAAPRFALPKDDTTLKDVTIAPSAPAVQTLLSIPELAGSVDRQLVPHEILASPRSLPLPSGVTLKTSYPVRLRAAENGSYYGIPNACDVPKTVSVSGYFRGDGTYVRSHYCSAPRR